MNRLILVLISLLFLQGNRQDEKLDGLWMSAYSLSDNGPDNRPMKSLMEFEGDSLRLISIEHDGKVSTIRTSYRLNKKRSRVSLRSIEGKKTFEISYWADSLILSVIDKRVEG